MGFLDGILGNKEEPAREGLPFNISTSLRPVRLAARRENCLEVLVTIKNVSDSPFMASATIEVPRALGFENLGITRIKEIRMGELAPQAEKTISFSLCANSQTVAGVYAALLTVNQHYRDYAHVLNYAKKSVEVRAV
ncbi:MAG: hypothetical protein NT051_07045 [Candidatus Micrarchaeota archaeon]|nr:hypothetical protein [Candidatus Micrarchaeota archaeon]